MTKRSIPLISVLAVLGLSLVLGCAIQRPSRSELHRWWSGLGPVIPHDTFPTDCKLCHAGNTWNELVETFQFDHEKETGVPLIGAHARAQCLRCHNDRGPVKVFHERGCGGCHEDVHGGGLGTRCTECHGQSTWHPVGQIARHQRTRFPLVGAHLAVACHRCHPGAGLGHFVPTSHECVSCHTDDLNNTQNPPHIPLGWVDRCHRCHFPTAWNQARIR